MSDKDYNACPDSDDTNKGKRKPTVNISKAKLQLSNLIKAIENKEENEIIITRFGRPIARLIPLEPTVDVSARIGIAKNYLSIPDDIDANNAEVATLILGADA